jgi:hypothetical protein
MTYEYKSPFDFDVSKMTVEEVIERLRAQGIEPNEWVDNEERFKQGKTKEGQKAKIPTLEAYAHILDQIKKVVEKQVENDVKETDDLVYQLRRIKRGGSGGRK